MQSVLIASDMGMVRLHRASARLLAIARSQNLNSRHDHRSQRPHPLFVDFRDICPAYEKELLRENHFAVEAIDLMVKHAEFIAIFTHEIHGLEPPSPRELELICTDMFTDAMKLRGPIGAIQNIHISQS